MGCHTIWGWAKAPGTSTTVGSCLTSALLLPLVVSLVIRGDSSEVCVRGSLETVVEWVRCDGVLFGGITIKQYLLYIEIEASLHLSASFHLFRSVKRRDGRIQLSQRRPEFTASSRRHLTLCPLSRPLETLVVYPN